VIQVLMAGVALPRHVLRAELLGVVHVRRPVRLAALAEGVKAVGDLPGGTPGGRELVPAPLMVVMHVVAVVLDG